MDNVYRVYKPVSSENFAVVETWSVTPSALVSSKSIKSDMNVTISSTNDTSLISVSASPAGTPPAYGQFIQAQKWQDILDQNGANYGSFDATITALRTVFADSIGGGGGGGDATAANQTQQINLETTIRNNVLRGKLARIQNSDDYVQTISYHNPLNNNSNITSIVHSGTTINGAESVTQTFTYVNVAQNNSNLLTATLS